MNKRYQVFVSSTYLDLHRERELIINSLNRIGFIGVGMEQFPSSDEGQFDYIKRIIDESDYYVLILKGRYGSTDKKGIGYTEKEYNYAIKRGIPTLSFLFKYPETLLVTETDDDGNKLKKLKKFRALLKSNKLISYWESQDNLVSSVKDSLHEIARLKPGIGWARGGDTIPLTVFETIEQLREENVKLKEAASDRKIEFEFPSDIEGPDDVFDLSIELTFRIYIKNTGETKSDSEIIKMSLTWGEFFCIVYTQIAEDSEVEHLHNCAALTFLCKNPAFRQTTDNEYVSHHVYHLGKIGIQFEALGLITVSYEKGERSEDSSNYIRFGSGKKTIWVLTEKGRKYASRKLATQKIII